MKTVLVFAPHNDDEVLGCGGTLALLAKAGYRVVVCEVTSGYDEQLVERIKSEARNAHTILGVEKSVFMDLPVVNLNGVPQGKLTKAFCDVVQQEKPEIVFIPHKGDMHVDHRVVSDAAMVAIRPLQAPFVQKIFVYETLSETEWNIPSTENVFMPNYWVDITDTYDTKVEAMKCYHTQLCEFPHPRSIGAIEALASLRGSTVGVKKAEAFTLIRGIIKNNMEII